jgi:ElaB/YqjD/DUF883 family membrane-anchored ribosome-binding protein
MNLPAFERRLSNRQRTLIARTLPRLREGVHLANVLNQIETATQWYWFDESKTHSAARKQMVSDLAQVALRAQELTRALNSMAFDSCYALRARLEGELDPENARISQIRYYVERLQSAAQSLISRGRPRELALQEYAGMLVSIYEDAIGTKPRRRYNSFRVGREEHIPFFAACMAAAGVVDYPAFIIRQAIGGRVPQGTRRRD